MNKQEEKALGEAYDKLYDADSVFRYKFPNLLKQLEDFANEKGYEFKLNAFDKWKCKQVKL